MMFNHRLTLCKYVHNAYMELIAPVLKSRDLNKLQSFLKFASKCFSQLSQKK